MKSILIPRSFCYIQPLHSMILIMPQIKFSKDLHNHEKCFLNE
ncbi:hypothetical protein PVAP13_2NG173509 [Panicum virgatum]|uniref:Uncharacterized protein n=1 Tax=Panicum virgatum TaxID=38727 RepID=A0A8T0VJL9_PANVG|nr:hypothetical protein PVAP13_2NG173509 [Panicum virgatum]